MSTSDLQSHVRDLIQILGDDALLIPCRHGTKQPALKAWGNLTAQAMRDPKHIAKLSGRCNIGVALGITSGGLISIDIDQDDAVNPFLQRNPSLQQTFRTKGRRGCNFWARMLGDYPPTFKRPWGEFRSHKAYTIAWGLHPEGLRYQWLNRSKPIVIPYASITWPDGTAFTQRDRDTEESEDTHETEEIIGVGGGLSPAPLSQLDVIVQCLPLSSGFNHKLLHKLNRGIRRLEIQDGRSYSPGEREAVFDAWYELALPTGFLRPDQNKTEYLLEFMASTNVTTPLGFDGLSQAAAKAKANPPPLEAARFKDSPPAQLLLGICYQLQLSYGTEPFYLAGRSAAPHVGVCPKTCATMLKGFCGLKILTLVSKGSMNQASRYHYTSLVNP